MNNVTIDINQLTSAFNALTSRQQRSVYQRAIKKSMGILHKEALSNLRLATNKDGGALKYKSLLRGVKLTPYKRIIGANVNILNDHRLKWFEMGTKRRRTRAGKYTGSIKKTDFFKKANDNKMDAVYDDLEKNITQNIVKAFNKKYK